MTGYSPVPQQRFESPEITPARISSPAPSSLRAPAFKGSGMKLGSKKTKQAELLDALGGEGLAYEEASAPATPVAPAIPKDTRGSVPKVTMERCVLLTSYLCSLLI